MKGIYINLDRSVERRRSLLGHLSSVGFSQNDYVRFPAIEPVGDNIKLPLGVKSRGELGLYQSFIQVFSQIGNGDFEDIVHVIEDDIRFSGAAAISTSRLSRIMLSRPELANADIIFLDYFLTRDLFLEVMSIQRKVKSNQFVLLPAKSCYFACTTSFLVRKSSALRLSSLLKTYLVSAKRFAPVDLVLRSLLRNGSLIGYVAVPLIGSPSWEHDQNSTIQCLDSDAVRFARRSHLLLKLLASGIQTPYWCAQQLEHMTGVTSPLSASDDYHSFFSFFDSFKDRMKMF